MIGGRDLDIAAPTHRRRMAALVSGIFWLRFWIVGGSRDASSIFVHSLRGKLTTVSTQIGLKYNRAHVGRMKQN